MSTFAKNHCLIPLRNRRSSIGKRARLVRLGHQRRMQTKIRWKELRALALKLLELVRRPDPVPVEKKPWWKFGLGEQN